MVSHLSKLLAPSEWSSRLRKAMRKRIEASLITVLRDAGFEPIGYPMFDEGPLPKKTNPFGVFRRRRDTVDNLVEILFDKYGYPEFRIAFGSAPHEGVLVWEKFVPLERMQVAECPENYRLSSSKDAERPFGVLWPFQGVASVEATVFSARTLMPQMFEWFDTGKVGTHLWPTQNSPVHRIGENS